MIDIQPNPFVGIWGVRGGKTVAGGVSTAANDMPYWADLLGVDFFVGPRPAPVELTEAEYCASAAAVGAKAILYAPDSTVKASAYNGFGGWLNTDEPEFKEKAAAFVDRFDKFKGRGPVWGQFTHNALHPTDTLDSSEYDRYLRGCHMWGFNRYPEQYNIPLDLWENLATRLWGVMAGLAGDVYDPVRGAAAFPWFYCAATALHIKGGYAPTPESIGRQLRWAKRMGARGVVLFVIVPQASNASGPPSWNGTSPELLAALPGLIAEFRAPAAPPETQVETLERELAAARDTIRRQGVEIRVKAAKLAAYRNVGFMPEE